MGNKKAKEYEDIAEEAQSGFDLRARLAGVTALTQTVTVFTDAVTGKELGGAEEITDRGINTGQKKRWGVQGRIDEIEERAAALLKQYQTNPDNVDDPSEEVAALEKELATLRTKSKPLLKKLNETALVFTLRAVPDLVLRDARRKAKANLGIKGKGIPQSEEIQEDFHIEHTCLVLAASVEKWVDNADGMTHTSLSLQQAKDLRNFLPVGQFDKLDRALYELSLKAQIGNVATDSPDF